jgi:hypothetical protein
VALDAVDRVGGDELAALGVAQNRAEDHEDLAGGVGALVVGMPAFDVLAGDGAELELAERWEEVGVDEVAVVLERGVLQAALSLAALEPLCRHRREPRPGRSCPPGRRARRSEDQLQPVGGFGWRKKVGRVGLGAVGGAPDDRAARRALAAVF